MNPYRYELIGSYKNMFAQSLRLFIVLLTIRKNITTDYFKMVLKLVLMTFIFRWDWSTSDQRWKRFQMKCC